MISDISKWKIKDDGTIDTSKGDNILNPIYEQDKKWRKERRLIPRPRKILTDEERKQRIKEYQHKYYMQVTKVKRKQKRGVLDVSITNKKEMV